MNCPSCDKPPTSILRSGFSLQGVSLSQNIQGYLKCQHCGKLLQITNIHLAVIVPTIAGALSVAIYAFFFRWIKMLVGFKIAVALYFPFLIVLVIAANYFIFTKYAKLISADEPSDHP